MGSSTAVQGFVCSGHILNPATAHLKIVIDCRRINCHDHDDAICLRAEQQSTRHGARFCGLCEEGHQSEKPRKKFQRKKENGHRLCCGRLSRRACLERYSIFGSSIPLQRRTLRSCLVRRACRSFPFRHRDSSPKHPGRIQTPTGTDPRPQH